MLKENLINVQQNIISACRRAGRDNNEVTLIAVSKTKPNEMIEEIYELGVRDFGENKVQELTDKYEAFTEQGKTDIRWHQIGHLQRNKVKYIVDKATLIHSVDSERLALQIEEEAAKKNIICNILIEVNVAEEETKFGVKPDEVEDFIRQIASMPHICIRGLMTVAPNVENAESNRMIFRQMHELYVDINGKNIDNKRGGYISMDVLSMGMTGDYEVAIEEGATMVRVGTGIFGQRNYII